MLVLTWFECILTNLFKTNLNIYYDWGLGTAVGNNNGRAKKGNKKYLFVWVTGTVSQFWPRGPEIA